METDSLLPKQININRVTYRDVWNELAALTRFAAPITIATFLVSFIDTINAIYLGRVGDKELAAASLAMIIMATFCVLPIAGMIGALDTLGPRAYSNPETRYQLNIYFQRVFFIVNLMLIPSIIFLFNLNSILPLVFQDRELNQLTGLMGKYVVLTLIPLVYSQLLRSYLVSQGIVYPWLIFSMLTLPLLMILLYLVDRFIPLSNSFLVVPISFGTSVSLGTLILAGMGYHQGGFAHWKGFSRDGLRGWSTIVKLGLWSCVMAGGEVWTLQVITLASGYFGTNMLISQSVVTSILSLFNFIYTSLGSAATTRLGHLIGLQKSQTAQLSSRIVIVISFSFGLIAWLLTQFFSKEFVSIFIPGSGSIDLSASILSKVAIGQLLQSLSAVSNGILVGMGRQREGGIIQLFGAHFFALPIGIILAFYFDFQTLGLLIGLITGYGVVGLTQISYILSKDWNEEMKRCSYLADNELSASCQ